eukprot:5643492-Pyramimonas_sp.AAC.1
MVFEDCAALGGQAIIICLGANTTIDNHHLLSAIFHTGKWHDVVAIHGPEPTFSHNPNWNRISSGLSLARPDMTVVNALVKYMLSSFEPSRDLGVKQHLGLQRGL